MKAFLITLNHAAKRCEVKPVEVRENDGEIDITHFYELLDVDLFGVVRPRGRALAGHCAYIDDNGLAKPQEGYILCQELYPLPIAGPLLLLGEGYAGSAAAATVDEATLRALFEKSYVNRNYARSAHQLHEMKTQATAGPHEFVLTPSKSM